ncbi:SusC/RagA family TonB-linked outer membrane protein [Sphingobacterium bovistauri]|uniref:SusC/RagA family TonB-linked outer membrane protein n=1 Tax=Sphingobacterium bovistauri TaxID=2781959 RepID=A0ABS7Z912_9SPHI|nr:SusC/RagA family TonB-linked outer membrane protein [Sphingobacterium bovistauri]MCA5006683.1 SusC/RagA family TonB-linked outer membrane protein [Sphingobacterium bovistauri]
MDVLNRNTVTWKLICKTFLLGVLSVLISNNVSAQNRTSISGRIVDSESKAPLVGVSVKIDGSKNSATSNKEGDYTIYGDVAPNKITFTFLGYKTKVISLKEKMTVLNVELETDSKNIDEVVVTGMFERKKESFSGIAKTVSGEELRMIGTQNVVQSLRSLDPSFILVENNLGGSDPNRLANIELRGKTSVSNVDQNGALIDQTGLNPNLPLFILNGFESSLREITDLDINRILSVTILKDAASAAIYGARSANGVVVVETIRPRPGKMNLSFTSSTSFQIPDLSDYNMMNAKEKLEYEILAGRYDAQNAQLYDYVIQERFKNKRQKMVEEGVNTYWLIKPLDKIAISNNNSVFIDGGADEFQYSLGANLNSVDGIMKSSGRKTWGANADFVYRNNRFNISNKVFISGNRAQESPYGSFATYVNINPYYKSDQNDRYLEETPTGFNGRSVYRVSNPLYNAQLNSERYSTGLNINNILSFNYDINTAFRVVGAGRILKSMNNSVNFVSPLDTRFDNSIIEEKGMYSDSKSDGLEYSGNIGVTYNKVFNIKHVFTANTRFDIQEENRKTLGLTAVGFPTGVDGNPAFAYSYQPNSRPFVDFPTKVRRVNALISTNYSYANSYFADFTYRIDGSTAFGSAKKYSPFWSIGAGWVMHNEEFLKNSNWISKAILRANIGTTGNQNFGNFLSATVYNLENISNKFGQSLFHTGVGNPNLNWQKTMNSSVGLDMGLLEDRIRFVLNAYQKITDPLILTIDMPLSNAIRNYATNLGSMTYRGVEADISYSPIYRLNDRVIWTLRVFGSVYKSKYGGFDDSNVGVMNEILTSNAYLQRFQNGNSPDDLWSYKSLGIDPSSGREVFLDKDDKYIFDYNEANIRVVGSGRPLVEGVMNSNLRLKNFNFNVAFRYNIGASKFNNALYNKVENISFDELEFNQDRRALELRWKNPGEIAQFKGIKETSLTPISSRFIQKETYFSGESISVGYDFQSTKHVWLSSVGLKSLRFTGYMNDIFRVSNVLSERGLDYPFSRSVSFSINANF